MDDDQIFQSVCKEIFGMDVKLTLDQGAKLFSHGVAIPKPKKTISGETVYALFDADVPSFVSDKDTARMIQEDKVMLPINGQSEQNPTMKDLAKMCGGIASFLGSKMINSQNCEKSDNVLGSMSVFMSSQISSSKYVGFSSSVSGCEYVYGSRFMDDSSFCISCQDSKLLNNCFEVSWSAKCSNCLFCHNCFDLHDCMFCFHAASKQYCIANRQYTREEYFRIKKMVCDYLSKNNFKLGFFPQI